MASFKTIEEAKKAILHGHFDCKEAMEAGDYKINNKIILKSINPAFNYIRDNNGISSLIEFLTHEEISMRLSLLPYYEEIATHALQDIIEKEIPYKAYKAKIILNEWENNPREWEE